MQLSSRGFLCKFHFDCFVIARFSTDLFISEIEFQWCSQFFSILFEVSYYFYQFLRNLTIRLKWMSCSPRFSGNLLWDESIGSPNKLSICSSSTRLSLLISVFISRKANAISKSALEKILDYSYQAESSEVFLMEHFILCSVDFQFFFYIGNMSC